MKQIATIICIAGLTGLSTSAFSSSATLADATPDMKSAALSQPIYLAVSEAETDNKSASQPVIQGNEMQDERMEFEEKAARREFGDESNREDFMEQEIRKEFGGRTEFIEPVVPQTEEHNH